MDLSRRTFFKFAGAAGAAGVVARPKPAAAAALHPVNTPAVLVDTTRCVGCRGCEAACGEANALPAPAMAGQDAVFAKRRTTGVNIYTIVNRGTTKSKQGEERFVKRQCMHCLDPACASACLAKAFSSAPGQEAADGHGRNSPFTASLLRHLPQPGLEVSVMLKEVTADVRLETRNAQRPQQLSDMSKTFYFVKAEPVAVTTPAPVAAIPPAPPVAPRDPVDPVDLAFWQSASAANECESIRAYVRRFPAGKFVDLARISERRLCKTGGEVAIVAQPRPSSGSVAPTLTPGPAAPVASVPSAITEPAGSITNVAIATPTAAPPSVAPVVTPVVAPAVLDVARNLQKELLRVGCGMGGIEIDGTWGAASRDALRSFNARTRSSLAVVDQPTPEALEAVRNHKDRVCPTACEPGTELRGTACVAVPPKALERSRHASRPPEHDRSLRAPHHVEPGRADAPPRPGPRSQSYANVPALNTRNGESWIYVGKQRCKTFEPPGSPPRIICP